MRLPTTTILLALFIPTFSTARLVLPDDPGGLQRCVDSGSAVCTLAPGKHEIAATVTTAASVTPQAGAVRIEWQAGAELTGAVALGASVEWQVHSGAIYRTTVPPALRKPGGFEQLWAGETWLPEARWPNVDLVRPGGPANVPGGPLSLDSWATTYGRVGQTDNDTDCTRLRRGVIVDPALGKTSIDFTGALATLNVGYRYLTWTRRVLEHGAGSSTFRYNQSLGAGGGRCQCQGDGQESRGRRRRRRRRRRRHCCHCRHCRCEVSSC